MPQLNHTDSSRAPGGRRGFTLVELLVVVVMISILMGALTALFLSQQRFYGDISELASVRRELRAGASILPLDIRGISGPGNDIAAASATSLTLKAPVGSAVICEIAPDRRSFHIFPTNLVANTLSSFWTEPLPTDSIFIFDDGPGSGAEDDEWRRHSIGSVGSSSACDVGSTPYTTLAADDAGSRPRTQVTLGGGATLQPHIEVGSVVRFTRLMEYELYQPGSGTGWYIGMRENLDGSWSDLSPVSGPYRAPAQGGVQFAYLDTLGAAVTGSSAADLARIARVDVTMRASGREARSFGFSGPITDSLFLSVGIRNFR